MKTLLIIMAASGIFGRRFTNNCPNGICAPQTQNVYTQYMAPKALEKSEQEPKAQELIVDWKGYFEKYPEEKAKVLEVLGCKCENCKCKDEPKNEQPKNEQPKNEQPKVTYSTKPKPTSFKPAVVD